MANPSPELIQRATIQAIGVVIGLLFFLQVTSSSNGNRITGASTTPTTTAGFDTITLAMVGDLMCHSQQFERARTATGYDFQPVFEPVKKYLSGATLTFGNLETVTAGADAKFTGYPMFNTPVEYLDALKEAGFDVITTANNHSLDRRFPGVVKTLDELDKRNLLHTGTARSATERNTPLIITNQSFKFGILAYTFSTNGIPIPAGQEFCVNMIDTLQMRKDIEAIRAAGAETIAVFIHWGDEYQRYANDRQKKIASFLHDQGVMLIIGSHPHVLQPVQIMAGGDEASFIAYSLGNFVSGQRKQYTDCGMILRIKLIRNRETGEIKYNQNDYIPTYVSTARGYRILPVADAIQAIRKGDKTHIAYTPDVREQARIQQVWKETTQHMDNSMFAFYVSEGNAAESEKE